MPGTGPSRRSSGPVRNQAIVGKSRIGATLHRCEPSVFLLHTNHFPVAETLDHAHTFFHPQTQQYESPPNTAKSSLNLTPKRDSDAVPGQKIARSCWSLAIFRRSPSSTKISCVGSSIHFSLAAYF